MSKELFVVEFESCAFEITILLLDVWILIPLPAVIWTLSIKELIVTALESTYCFCYFMLLSTYFFTALAVTAIEVLSVISLANFTIPFF